MNSETQYAESHDAEARLLSVMMKEGTEVSAAISSGVTVEHFTKSEHRAIFRAMVSAVASGGALDMAVVWSQLQTLNGKSPVSMSELVDVDGLVPTALERVKVTERVLALHRTRTLHNALLGGLEAVKKDANSWGERWENVAPFLERAQSVTTTSTTRRLPEICEATKNAIENPQDSEAIATGFASWDRAAGKLRPGEVVALAGRTGTGKTAFAVQLADQASIAGAGTAFFSLEMSGEELVNRIALRRTGKAAVANPKERIKALTELAKSKTLHIFDNAEAHTTDAIEARCRLLAASPVGLGLVIIDYLQLVIPPDRKAPREQQVAQMSRRFKQLAGALKVPVIVLAQLNRDCEKEGRPPLLSDLRESGAIEQDADRVWFLYQDPTEMPKMSEEPDDIPIRLIQEKCRGGKPHLSTSLEFQRSIFRFLPIDRRATA